ncbi:MAG: squalene synthase HpnC [Rhodospirillales bacterium]|nr:squalene synthase HpnC [Rhodospirillales bacterium]
MDGQSHSDIETPSGKDVAYENFPVGSWLLPARLRPHIAAFYAFARSADDIADNPDLDPEDKVSRLDRFEEGVLGRDCDSPALAKAHAMRDSLMETGVTPQHCVDLLAAFKMDATKLRYDDWDDLMGYCELSAAPVGRYLLDLHGGSRDGYAASDALGMALQVINHVQDCKDDYLKVDRVYLPLDWMMQNGTSVEALAEETSNPAMRRVLASTLDRTEGLLAIAEKLPRGLISRRLAMESGAIIAIAHRLIGLLRHGDPLGPRIELGKGAFLWSCTRGALSALI